MLPKAKVNPTPPPPPVRLVPPSGSQSSTDRYNPVGQTAEGKPIYSSGAEKPKLLYPTIKIKRKTMPSMSDTSPVPDDECALPEDTSNSAEPTDTESYSSTSSYDSDRLLAACKTVEEIKDKKEGFVKKRSPIEVVDDEVPDDRSQTSTKRSRSTTPDYGSSSHGEPSDKEEDQDQYSSPKTNVVLRSAADVRKESEEAEAKRRRTFIDIRDL